MQAPNINLDTAKEFVKDVNIPPQPQMLIDIRKHYPDIDKIAALVSRDPAIGATVLKTVNSPMFGIPKKIVKIEQAVMLLGLDSIMNIVNAVLMRASLASKINPASLKHFWQSANDVAVASHFIAKRLRVAPPDQAFLLGLFHNCAMPLIMEKFPHYFDVVKQGYADAGSEVTANEDAAFQANHAIIGEHIARTWHLPEGVMRAIGDHHKPERLACNASDGEEMVVDNLCAVLKMAEHIAQEYHALGESDIDHEWEQFGSAILALVGISEDDFTTLSEEVTEAIQAADLNFNA